MPTSFHHTRLPNGLQVIGERSPSARSAALGFFVRTGSRDETPAESGVSHFLEHMLFKGTERRSAVDVNRDFDAVGARSNAYTSEENTVYYTPVLPEYLTDALDVLADMLRPALRQDDFDTEKKVILEEIDMYQDQPASVADDYAREYHFRGHPLGNSVLGTAESVGALTRGQMLDYFERRYAPTNVVVAVAGQFEWDDFAEQVARRCSHWAGPPARREHLRAAQTGGGAHAVRRAGVAQELGMLLAAAPACDSPLRYAADVLTLATGDEGSGRLHWALVDPGNADSADMRYQEFEAAGVYYTTFTSDPENAADNLATVRELLGELQRDGLSADELTLAKTKIVSRLVRSAERPMGRLQAVASSWSYLGEYRTVDEELARYEAVTVTTVRELLECHPVDRCTALAFGPLAEVAGVAAIDAPPPRRAAL